MESLDLDQYVNPHSFIFIVMRLILWFSLKGVLFSLYLRCLLEAKISGVIQRLGDLGSAENTVILLNQFSCIGFRRGSELLISTLKAVKLITFNFRSMIPCGTVQIWFVGIFKSISQSNFYGANIPGKAKLSGATAESVFNSKIKETIP